MDEFDRMRKRMRAEQKTYPALMDRWKDIPEGTPVTVTKDLGEKFETRTRSKPWLVGDGTPVILVEGISGGYLLSRLELRAPSPVSSKATTPAASSKGEP